MTARGKIGLLNVKWVARGLGGPPPRKFQEIKGVLVHSAGFGQPELGILTI